MTSFLSWVKLLKMINYKNFNRYFSLTFARYILGRFYTIRKIYKILNKILFTSKVHPDINDYIIFNSSQNELLNDLTVSGVSKKLFLKKEINNFILDNYKNSKFISEKIFKQDRHEFKNFNDFKKSKIISPFFELENEDFKALFDKISKSRELLEIAKKYLGSVKKIDIRLTYSTVVNLEDAQREKYRQTVNWHYDVHDLNFLYAFFYISGANRLSGSHEVIKKSHKKKMFFKHLVGSVIQSDYDLRNYYDNENFFTIEGLPGEGFIEDTSCFHRALKPIEQPRLCLQVRYH